jgi:hypothetical protein
LSNLLYADKWAGGNDTEAADQDIISEQRDVSGVINWGKITSIAQSGPFKDEQILFL